MRIINYILTFTALAMALSACQDTAQSQIDGDTVAANVTLRIAVHQGLDMASRATGGYDSQYNLAPRRPVVWDGQQCINDMRIYVFSAAEVGGPYKYDGGGNCADGGYKIVDFHNSSPWTDSDYETHEYVFNPTVQKHRYYKFLAVGRDDADGTSIPERLVAYIPWGTRTLSDLDLQVGVTELHEAELTNQLRSTHYPYVCTEVFTGIMTYTDVNGSLAEDYIYVDDNSIGFTRTIELKRAVAGLWVYVTDIPTSVIDNSGSEFDGLRFSPDELTIHMHVAPRSLNLASQHEGTSKRYESIQIGYIDFKNIYGEVDGKTWYKTGATPYWQRGCIDNFRGISLAENSALISNFLMPIDTDKILEDGEATLTVQLREYETEYRFTRQVRCRIETVTDPVTGDKRPYTGSDKAFPILANSLYTIGTPEAPYSLAGMASRADDDIEILVVSY